MSLCVPSLWSLQLGCLTCVILHLWQSPCGIPSLCPTVIWMNLTISLGVLVLQSGLLCVSIRVKLFDPKQNIRQAMITFLVQSFFAYRIYRLQKKRLAVAVPIVTLAFFRLFAANVSMGMMIRLQSYTAFVQQPLSRWIFTVGLSLSVLVDIMIVAFMCYFLRKNRTVVTSTIRIIDTLTLWTIRNGSMTSAAAIASLICWLVMPGNRIFLGLHFVVAKCKTS